MSKVILITGAANGIGRASAETLMSEGYTVYGTDIAFDAMEDLEVNGMRRLRMDVTSGRDVDSAVETIMNEEGRIDGVHANAGYTLMGMIECTEMEDAQRQFEVNLWGTVRVVKAALPFMRKQRSGRILITSSVVGDLPCPGMAFYTATKHALEAYGAALRMELRPHNIQVSMLKPGFLNTKLMGFSMATLDKAERSPSANGYVEEHKAFRKNFSEGFSSGGTAQTVARSVSHAFGSPSPKRRYIPNGDAKFGVFAKRFFPAPLVEKVTMDRFVR